MAVTLTRANRFTPEDARKARAIAVENARLRRIDAALLKTDQNYASRHFVAKTLPDARAAVTKLLSMLNNSNDTEQIQQIANALSRVSELERVLAGRPLPKGERRAEPSAQRHRPSTITLEMLPAEPLNAPAEADKGDKKDTTDTQVVE